MSTWYKFHCVYNVFFIWFYSFLCLFLFLSLFCFCYCCCFFNNVWCFLSCYDILLYTKQHLVVHYQDRNEVTIAAPMNSWDEVSLNENVASCYNIFGSIVCNIFCYITTRVKVIRNSTCAKPNSGIGLGTVVFVVANDTDSCFGKGFIGAYGWYIEPFPVAVILQRALCTKQRFPRFTA